MITLASLIAGAIDKGAKQEDIAESAKLSQARVSELMNGKGLPRSRALPDLAKALGVKTSLLARVVAADRRRAHAPDRTKSGAR